MVRTRFARIAILIAIVSFALLVPRATRAQDEAYVLTMSDSSGQIDETATVSVTLDNDGEPIEAYEFGVCHDELISISSGDVSNGTFVDENYFVLHTVSYYDDGWTVATIVDIFDYDALPIGTEQELYTAEYSLDESGDASVEICDTLGDPAIEPTISIDGGDLVPTTQAGSIAISSGPQFLRGDVNGDGRVNMIDAFAMYSEIIFPPGPFDGSTFACVAASDVDGNGDNFLLLDTLYLFEFVFTGGTAPGAPYPDCGAVDDADCEQPPDPCPALPLDLEADDDYTLALSSSTGAAGGSATVLVQLSSSDYVTGVQFGLCHDDLLSLTEEPVVVGSALSDLEYSLVTEIGDEGELLVSVITATLTDIDFLESGDDLELFEVTYLLSEDVGTATIEFCSGEGALPITPAVVVVGELLAPTLEYGTIDIVQFEFLRGDADGNGEVFGLVDALYLLAYGFTAGPTPPCLDAADFDDNGSVFPLIDALGILNWTFTSGASPPDPGATDCGSDPTADDVDCQESCL